ncbi:30S ribosomal protein S16 [Limisphaera ngatamarikiensis]|jgi:small subunit ribosomal protein S16|uniref:Small ribosomal subunit protein bS16 n=1 Tax=Limisphaera ngatamarikiensis TaxID=1324935 RepID=A0A6M1RRP8_9BACT|nr:30S ribosomal protein S16 [Limisphaera ngatamarikiensis]NGO40293.1 30S ribosomal protein S16 [Limisphaera ngatamarikiensis]
MVRIRLKRVGAKNKPFYRIVVADSRARRDGKCLDEIGTYNPLAKGENVTLDLQKVDLWLSRGAQPTETVASFIRRLRSAAGAAKAQAA